MPKDHPPPQSSLWERPEVPKLCSVESVKNNHRTSFNGDVYSIWPNMRLRKQPCAHQAVDYQRHYGQIIQRMLAYSTGTYSLTVWLQSVLHAAAERKICESNQKSCTPAPATDLSTFSSDHHYRSPIQFRRSGSCS